MPEYDWCGTDDEPPPDSIPAPAAHLFTPGHMHDHATTGFDIAAVENEYCVASPDPVVWPGRGDVSSTSASESESEEADGAEEEWTGSSAAESESEAGTDKINAIEQQPAQVSLDQLLSDASATAATRAKTELATPRSTQPTQEREQEEEREQVSLDQLLLDAQAAVAETAARKDVSARGALSTAASAIATSAPIKSAREASAKEEIAVEEAVDSFDGGHPPFAIICTSPPGALQMPSVAARSSTSNFRVESRWLLNLGHSQAAATFAHLLGFHTMVNAAHRTLCPLPLP